MLKVKSFTFDQEKEMNEFLANNLLAKGASVFVSDGKIIFPVEDGEAKSKEQMIFSIQEQKNTILDQLEIVNHSQRVLERLMTDAKPRIDEAKANLAEAASQKRRDRDNNKIKLYEQKSSVASNALEQLETQHFQNSMEVARLTLNIELFDERIKELSA